MGTNTSLTSGHWTSNMIRIANGGSQCGLELHPLELDSMSDAIGIKFDEYELGESFFHIRTPILE